MKNQFPPEQPEGLAIDLASGFSPVKLVPVSAKTYSIKKED